MKGRQTLNAGALSRVFAKGDFRDWEAVGAWAAVGIFAEDKTSCALGPKLPLITAATSLSIIHWEALTPAPPDALWAVFSSILNSLDSGLMSM